MGRLFLCLVVAWCLASLLSPVHGRVGPAGEFGGDRRPAPLTPFDHVAERGVKSSRPSWSWSWSSTTRSPPAGRGASAGDEAELRSVPAGPDPMHHHGSPKRPEHERIGP